MSSPADTAELLQALEEQRETGCLSVSSADGSAARLYLVAGRVFHAEAAGLEGRPALAAALAWPDVTLTFDSRARLPEKQTLDVESEGGAATIQARPGTAGLRSPALQAGIVERPRGVDTLSDDSRLQTLSCLSLGGGCTVILIPAALFGIGALLSSQHVNADFFATAGLVSIPVLFLLWLGVYMWQRILFFRSAVTVSGAPARSQIPRVVDAAEGVITGQPVLSVKMNTRSPLGRHGQCLVELYSGGIQIWKGPKQAEPRWQFSYSNLVHAESITVSSVGGRVSTTRSYVRLVVARPRMAFLLGNTWFYNRGAQVLAAALGQHGVTTFNETFET